MNAGRDVERLISSWFADEAEVRAPDRVLESARQSIDRTAQRRFLAAWREPVNISMTRVTALAAVLVVALVGAAWIGRITAPGVGVPTVSPSPVATAQATAATTTLESYKLAHDEICMRYRGQQEPLKPLLDGLFDEELPEDERTLKAGVLRGYVNTAEAMVAELAGLLPPPEIAAEHEEMLFNWRAVNGLIRDALSKLARVTSREPGRATPPRTRPAAPSWTSRRHTPASLPLTEPAGASLRSPGRHSGRRGTSGTIRRRARRPSRARARPPDREVPSTWPERPASGPAPAPRPASSASGAPSAATRSSARAAPRRRPW